MTEQNNALTDLFAACWKDDALKARFMAEPKAVLAERGFVVPDDMTVKVLENNDNTAHITLPMPPKGHEELSDEQLSLASGGAACTGNVELAAPAALNSCFVNDGMMSG